MIGGTQTMPEVGTEVDVNIGTKFDPIWASSTVEGLFEPQADIVRWSFGSRLLKVRVNAREPHGGELFTVNAYAQGVAWRPNNPS